MKRWFRNIILLLLPFLMMIVINEWVRPSIAQQAQVRKGVVAINTGEKDVAKCSWACHYDTDFCKTHHVKLPEQYWKYTDKLYFSIIGALYTTGDYGLANIVFLVILLPLIMYLLLIKSLNLQAEIRALKSKR